MKESSPSAVHENPRAEEPVAFRLLEKLLRKGLLTVEEAEEIRRDVGDTSGLVRGDVAPPQTIDATPLTTLLSAEEVCNGKSDRGHRRNLRATIQKSVRIRPDDARYREETAKSLNASRDGLYFTTAADHYYGGMRLHIAFPYCPSDPCNSERLAEVVRTQGLKDGRTGVAIRFLSR